MCYRAAIVRGGLPIPIGRRAGGGELTDNSPKAVVLRHIELYSDGTPDSYGSDRWLDVWAEDSAQEFLPSAQFPKGMRFEGKAAIRENLREVSATWRDRRQVVHDIIAEGDRVALLSTWSAFPATDLGPIKAGTRMRLECTDFFRVKDGLIAEMIDNVGAMALAETKPERLRNHNG